MNQHPEKTRTFGTVRFTFQAASFEKMTHDGSHLVFEQSQIHLHGLVPIHSHEGGPCNAPFYETYVLDADDKEHDVRIVTIANGHWENMTVQQLRDLLARQEPMVPGVPYNCGPGLAHAMVNMKGATENSNCLPVVHSTKYYLRHQV